MPSAIQVLREVPASRLGAVVGVGKQAHLCALYIRQHIPIVKEVCDLRVHGLAFLPAERRVQPVGVAGYSNIDGVLCEEVRELCH